MESLVYKFFRVFFRNNLGFSGNGPDFKPVESVNIPSIFAGPLLNRLINIEQLYKSGIGLDDIMDLNELLIVKNENERRSMEASKKK